MFLILCFLVETATTCLSYLNLKVLVSEGKKFMENFKNNCKKMKHEWSLQNYNQSYAFLHVGKIDKNYM